MKMKKLENLTVHQIWDLKSLNVLIGQITEDSSILDCGFAFSEL